MNQRCYSMINYLFISGCLLTSPYCSTTDSGMPFHLHLPSGCSDCQSRSQEYWSTLASLVQNHTNVHGF